jgi:hypothetical protein
MNRKLIIKKNIKEELREVLCFCLLLTFEEL